MGVWVQWKGVGGYQGAGIQKPCQELFLSRGIRSKGPKFKPRLSHLEQASEAGTQCPHLGKEGK